MPRIYTRREEKQGRYYGPAEEIKTNTAKEPTIVEVASTVFFLELSMLLHDRPYPKLLGQINISALAEAYCYPEDVVHQAVMAMFEEGWVEYRPDGLIEFMPAERRQLEREGV